MKLVTTITKENFISLSSTDNWYRWRDKDFENLRLLSKTSNPWGKVIVLPTFNYMKSNQTKYPYRLTLKVFPVEKNTEYPEVIIHRQIIKAHFPSTNNPNLLFAAFPIDNLLWLTYEFLQLEKQLYLIRGASGSGKTTLAKTLTQNRVISADNYPGLYIDGKYQLHLQEQSHLWSIQETEKLLKSGANVSVANTFSRKRYLSPYVELGKKYNYRVSIIHCEGNYGSVHNVPEEVRQRQLGTFEALETDGLKSLEIRLQDALKKEIITKENLHQLIDKLTQNYDSKSVINQSKNSEKSPDVNINSDKRGDGRVNENKTNDQRALESVELVKEAVDYLKKNQLWNNKLTARKKIELIQNYTKKHYKRTISSGTLYRDWCRELWNDN
ncbi:ATP-binding protein [Crocosphaera sp.]|uniref:ATP-binding protein n=1 Tax=Crocosphaera sp. TaxID=2729996 RepID=UPI002615FE7B|nr:ATP-binding protein [Crocosphaera sp.]MDJ0579665.1 ATP-binding protein [Crocosphaera sp.]